MTQISRDDIAMLARLSGLQMAEEELSELQNDVSQILSYVEQLSELDTDGVEPTYQPGALQNRWRNDDVQVSVPREQLLELTPAQHQHHVKVPKVL